MAAPATNPRKRPRTGYLAEPLSVEEQRKVGRMYREHQGILRLMGRKMFKKYPFVATDDLFSCCDIAFIKTCRAWQPAKGTFSTLLTVFCEGEILHWIRDNNWLVTAPGNVRRLGQRARRLLDASTPICEILKELDLTESALKLALVATQPTDHDIRGFELHICPRPTPWDALLSEEE